MPKETKVIDKEKLRQLVKLHIVDSASLSELCIKIAPEFKCSWSCIAQRIKQYGIYVPIPAGKRGAPKRIDNYNELIASFRSHGIELTDFRQCFKEDPKCKDAINTFMEKTK